jgi:hypothetical protein
VGTPLTILGSAVYAWYRSDLGVTLNSGNVSAWADQSGNQHNFTQPAAGAQPAYGTGGPGVAAINFTGTQILDTGANVTLVQPFTIYWVGQMLASSTSNEPYCIGGTGLQTLGSTGVETSLANNSAGYIVLGFSPLSYGQIYIQNTIVSGASSSVNAQTASNTYSKTGTLSPVTINNDELSIGNCAPAGVDYSYNGNVYEMLIIEGTPSAAKLSALGSYFTSIYGF